MLFSVVAKRDFFLDKKREKQKLEAEMKLIVTMKQLIPSGEAKPVAPLSVILGQFYLNLSDFCKDFNSKTQDWMPGIILPIKVIKGLRAKEYKLIISTPSISFLIQQCLDDELNSILRNSIYDIIKLKANLLGKHPRVVARMVFSTLSSTEIIIQ